MTTNIIKATTTGIKGTFTKDQKSGKDLDAQVNACLLENKIDQLGWF